MTSKNISPRAGQLGIAGIGVDIPLATQEVQGPEPRVRPNMGSRNAFGRVPFPDYFGVNPDTFDLVTPDAFEKSDPAVIEGNLYGKTEFSLKSPDQKVGWVVLNGAEYTIVPDFPEALARRVQARTTQTVAALIRPQEERNAAAIRSGAHALEPRIEPMVNLMNGYAYKIESLRELVPKIPLHYRAHATEGRMREITEVARGGMIEALQTVADVEHWTEEDLKLARIGLDKRLLEGRGQKRMDEKKEAWLGLSKVIGNHTIAKRVVVRDRLLRSQFEIRKRLRSA